MTRFYNLLEESTIFQGILVIMIFGLIAYGFIAGREIPKELWAMSGVVVGFFFGGKAVVAQRKAVQSTIESLTERK